MTEHRYILQPYKGINTRSRCPACNKNKTFSRYIDVTTNEHISDHVGKCNRESNCGYHYPPKQYFQDNPAVSGNTPQPKAYMPRPVKAQPKPVSFIPFEVFKQSLQIEKTVIQVAETNHFVKFLINLFGVEVANALVRRYFIATSKHWNGATVFWQVDTNDKVRTGKVMLYDSSTGKRIKEPNSHITWAHSLLQKREFELKQCFFGEHLLKLEPDKPVAIVESEKTALIASLYLPDFVWLASGGLSLLTQEKCEILKGSRVVLFPDVRGFQKWNTCAHYLCNIADFVVSDLLERKATDVEREQGADLADYLIKFNYPDFISKPKNENVINLECMIGKNPALTKLIKVFDLEIKN